MSNLDIEALLQEKQDEIELKIKAYLPPLGGNQKNIMNAMNYSVLAGGKRLRPIIMQETYRAFGGEADVIDPFIAAIEMVHTYSLVHDDLPAMDNDMLRRGKPTTHAKFGEAMGILAGDGLLNMAFETAAMAFSMVETENMPLVSEALSTMFMKSGIYGMIGGQVIDVESDKENTPLDEDELLEMYELKTGALLEASFMIGGILAGADDEEIELLEDIGKNLGLAFQIRDDILDIVGDENVLGKPIGSDERAGKLTYAARVGIEAAEKRILEYTNLTLAALEGLDRDTAFLEGLVKLLVSREK